MTKSDDKWAFDKHISVLSPCFERVADAIKIRYGAVTQQLPHNSVPTQLSSIIEAAFAASLRNEEQLPVQFQLICGDPNHFVRWGQQEAGHDNDWDFGFLPDVDLSPEVIRKLSAGLDYETSAILVCDGGSKPVIKGIVRFKKTGIAREPHRLNDVFTTERAIR
ncbi:MAG TPA: hypothetical protein VHU84_14385, partial [Lacipirellulaceae bacterium]|nr:hypothetical protein [Lacipirellulaceae bacterium]